MMGYEDERIAVEKRFADAWGGRTPVDYANTPFDVPTGQAWVALDIISSEGRRVSIGTQNRLVRLPGIIQISAFVPDESGASQAMELADAAAAVFAEAQFSHGDSGLIRCAVPSITARGETGGWFRVVLRVPFRRDLNLS